MQPPIEHPAYEYRQDDEMDSRRYGWPILKYASYAAFLALLLFLILR